MTIDDSDATRAVLTVLFRRAGHGTVDLSVDTGTMWTKYGVDARRGDGQSALRIVRQAADQKTLSFFIFDPHTMQPSRENTSPNTNICGEKTPVFKYQ